MYSLGLEFGDMLWLKSEAFWQWESEEAIFVFKKCNLCEL